MVGALEHVSHVDIPLRMLRRALVELFVREIFETRRKDVIRLIITEGPRFPKLAEFYYREVIARVHGSDARDAARARSSAANSRTTRWCAFRNCSSRPASSRSSGTACSIASSRSTSRAMLRAHFDILFGAGSAA